MEAPMRGFVIVVDMQRDFVLESGGLPVPGAERIVRPMQLWLSGLNPTHTAGILMTFDSHDPAAYAGSDESAQFPIHCVRGSPGWESVLDMGAINPGIPLYRMEKSVFDMWAEPALMLGAVGKDDREPIARDAFFSALRDQGIRTVTVVGVAADYCVRWAVEGLIARGFSVELPDSLTRGIEKDAAEVVRDHFPEVDVHLAEAGCGDRMRCAVANDSSLAAGRLD
jgi:nicotinamidase/pyrazinamidase